MNEEIRIGGFRVLNELASGTGSQGSVVRAVCEEATIPGVNVGDVVALKRMQSKDEDQGAWDKFKRRTKILASINHPNIVKYYGCFIHADTFSSSYVVVMEYLEGESLKERLQAAPGGLDADQALAVVNGALAGMAAAEAAGIVHRDIKPGNIFICKDGIPKLIDFEISKAAESSSVSSTGRFAGTFDYMAPEFADEKFRGDAKSDVFSMGVVLHEALTGVTPYAQSKQSGAQADFAFLSRWSQRVEGICAIHIKSSVRRVLSHADEVLLRALAEKREERIATAAQFLEAMKAIRFRELRNGTNAYRLLKLIGRGGFGEVFKARLRSTGEMVAVKHLLKSTYGDRFRREARVMKQLDDPAFVRFVDYFETSNAGGGEAFLVMAFLPGMPGSSLRDAIKRHKTSPLPSKDVFRAFALYAQALATMHHQGIYHRDIKPSNLYYPEQEPGKSAIMDFGIARDVNGTATAGQVPGTLDYMPPEVVVGGSRGDAGMDIYALGLCFYEALTGRMGYPRLPMGPDAFQAFYDRARSGVAPSFTGSEIERVPGLLELLQDMTALDPAMRLHDAEQLRRRILAVASGGVTAVVPKTKKREQPMAVTVVEPVRPMVQEPLTRDTAQTGLADLRRRMLGMNRDNAGMAIKAGWGILAVVVLAVVGIFLKEPISDAYENWLKNNEEQRIKKIQYEVAARERAEAEKERKRIEALRKSANSQADEVIRRIQTEKMTQLAASNLADEWKVAWQGTNEVSEVYRDICGKFDVELKDKEERDIRQRDKEKKEAEELARKKKEMEEAAAAKIRQDEINKAEKQRIKEVNEREILEAEKLLVAQAAKLCARYGNEKELAQAVDADRAQWETNWERYRNEQFYIKAAREIEEAKSERMLLESGRAVATECARWLTNIATVNADNISNWRNNVDRAKNELRKAVGEKRISAKAASAIDAKINACSRWTVGVIDNKTHETLDFCGKTIGPVESRAVIFREGLPEGAALTCEGYEPIRVREDRLDSKTFLVLPRDLKETRGTTRAMVPRMPANVVCFIDGVQKQPGEVKLRRGRHHAVYRNTKETYGGIRDFNDQDITFMTDDDGVTEIAGPSGKWSPSAEFSAREKNSGLVARGEKIVAAVKENIKPEPVDGRRDRLDKAYAIINDWRTAEALAVLGESVEKELRALYEAERKRTRGTVRNETPFEAKVRTDVGEFKIPPGESVTVTVEGRWNGELYAEISGYEFVMLPRVPSDFENKELVLKQEKLVPLPVQVTLPVLDKGVTCEIGGKKVSNTFELRPGTYEGVYRKADHLKQEFTVTIETGKPKRLPKPAKWEPSGAFSAFTEALSSFNAGTIDKAKKLSEKVGTIEDPERRQELEDLKKAIELREKLERIKNAK